MTSKQQRREIDYYDTDIDDDLEMHTTAYSTEASSTTTESPRTKLTFDRKSPSNQASSSSPIETAHCVAPAQIDWTERTEPKYKLNPEKYLIPALIWGPMNQGKHFIWLVF